MSDYSYKKWRGWLEQTPETDKPKVLTEQKDTGYGKRRGATVKPTKVEKKTLNIPYPKISDAWGEPGNKDRAEVEQLLRRVATGTTWVDKINNLNEFANSCKEQAGCLRQADSTILSKLMAMDVLVSIVYDFDASAGGFLFEAFLAALLGGSSEKIAASQSRAGGASGDIADVNLLGKPFSLKLLRKGASSIDGSYKDLIGTIARTGKPINYMVALKDLEKSNPPVIRFYEFTIGSSAFTQDEEGNLIHGPEHFGETPELAGYIDIDDPDLGFVKGTEFFVSTSFLKGTTKRVRGTKKKKQKLASLEFNSETAILNLGSKESLSELANSYANKMSSDIVAIYDALDGLSQNINKYLIGSQMAAGRVARTDANKVAYRTDKLIKSQEGEE
jgi:hypothetical protein|tara:strand:- start:70 stop:1236 length:1167 start_codon:yes stop_codon:yes gene_type:complete